MTEERFFELVASLKDEGFEAKLVDSFDVKSLAFYKDGLRYCAITSIYKIITGNSINIGGFSAAARAMGLDWFYSYQLAAANDNNTYSLYFNKELRQKLLEAAGLC